MGEYSLNNPARSSNTSPDVSPAKNGYGRCTYISKSGYHRNNSGYIPLQCMSFCVCEGVLKWVLECEWRVVGALQTWGVECTTQVKVVIWAWVNM